MSYTSHTAEPLLDDESIFIIAYQHTHTLPRTNCSSKKQAIMIDNVPVGWKLANSLLASQFSDNHWLSPSPYTTWIASYNIPILREVLVPEVVTMKFRRLLQVLLVQHTSKAQGKASVVVIRHSSQQVQVEVIEGTHLS